jgi:DNA invertase Pin-like site-specific DNA recombinase
MSAESATHPVIVDLYCRISTDPQEDNTSLDEQEAAGREYCRQNGLIVGMVHRETFSGYQYRERKKLSLMRERYRDGKIQGVVIRTLDRLSRSQTHVAILMEEMEHYGITLYSVKEVIDDTPMGKFARMVLAFVAEMEREKIMDRTITGKVNKAHEGKVVSGNKALYGWKWVHNDKGERDYLVLDEDQAKVLQQAGQEYADGVSLRSILKRLEMEKVPPPKGERWYPTTLRHTLTDPRMTGQNVKIFTVKNRRAKQHLDPVELPDGTYPRILSDEVYAKVLERASLNAAQASRNSKYPEMFLLRAGFARCAYCKQTMMARRIATRNEQWFGYSCPNRDGKCTRFAVPADKLDAAVWNTVAELADHIPLLEQSIELAMKNRSLDDDLRAIEATLADWKAKVRNYEEDLADSNLRGDTRTGIRNLLNTAYDMVEQLEKDRAEIVIFTVDRDRERAEYEKILAWCKKVKSEREELSYSQKRDFLYMLGASVLVYPQEHRGAAPTWDIRVALPTVQEIIYQEKGSAFGDALSANTHVPVSLPRSSSKTPSHCLP